jgi:enterochelin esterase-like enzyme
MLASAAVSFSVGGIQQVAVVPDTPAPRPMVLFLYGRGGHATDQLGNRPLWRAWRAAGDQAPVMVFAESNDHSYWHDRRERAWGRFLWRGVIPAAVRRFGVDRRRIAVAGISMGGFGALDLARLHPGAFCAVAAHSPAIWRTAAETAPGAFDDAADFARHDIVRLPAPRTRHLWLDAGTADPFDPGDRAYLRHVRRLHPVVHRWPGGHTGAYWQAHWPAYVRFYVRALRQC